ncbi:hypothetical protein [Niveibacterium sp. SC-1]|uniref:hypothetical protein n=1 Tax=Niveibacterium sp. SC-1 TaxID=3135646 RepID=UPI00311EB286
MFVIRLVGVLLALGILGCSFAYLLTRQRRYLGIALKLLKFGLVVVFVFFGLLIVERVLAPVL